jgi:radical SAM superfamily enzyme YgiQ (UPF0313 family)
MKYVIISGFGCKTFWLSDTRGEDNFRFNSYFNSYSALQNIFKPNIFIDLNSYLLTLNQNKKVDISNQPISNDLIKDLCDKISIATKEDIVLYSVDLIDNDLPAHVNKLFAAFHLNLKIIEYLSKRVSKVFIGGENAKFFNNEYLKLFRKKFDNVFIITGGNLEQLDVNKNENQSLDFIFPNLIDNLSCTVTEDESNYIKYDYDYINKVLNTNLIVENKYLKEFIFLSEVGCGNGCAFCCNGLQPVVSHLNVERRLDIIKSFIDNGFNAMTVINCTINKDRKFFHELCNYITRNNIKLHWSAHFDIKDITDNECAMAFEAGCKVSSLGIDSLDELQKRVIHKNLKKEILLDGINKLHNAGIWNRGNFILGMPYFNENELSLFEDFLSEVGRDKLNAVICSRFRVSNTSAIKLYPERFNIELNIKENNLFKNASKRKHFIVDDLMYPTKYKELTRYGYDEVGIHMRKIMDYIIKQSSSFWNYSDITRTNFVLYFLYDIFKTKDKVLAFLKERNENN